MALIVIDDDSTMLEALKSILDGFDEPYSAYTDPEKAMADFSQNPTHFYGAIIDYNLVQTTGIIVADKMRELNPDMEFIFCTATSDAHNRNLIEERGMWLAKPLNVHTSYALIRYFIELCSGRANILDEQKQLIATAHNVSLEASKLIHELSQKIDDNELKKKSQVVLAMLEEMINAKPAAAPTINKKPHLRVIK